MKFFSLLLIPVFLGFWDCDRPREPAQPVSAEASLSQVGWDIERELMRLLGARF